jgi:hypothetical protein
MANTTFSGPVRSTNGFVGNLTGNVTGNVTGTVTGTALVETVTSTNVITAAESGTTYFLSALAGFASTLPAPASGLSFSFIVISAPTSNGYTILTNASANIMSGTHNVSADGGGSAIALADTITLVANSAVAGDRVDVISNGSFWYVTAASTLKASITSAAT